MHSCYYTKIKLNQYFDVSAGLSRLNPHWIYRNIQGADARVLCHVMFGHICPSPPHSCPHTPGKDLHAAHCTHTFHHRRNEVIFWQQTDTSNTKLLSVFRSWQKDISFTNKHRNPWVPNLSISLFVGVHKHTRAQNLDLFLWTSRESTNKALKMALIPSVCLVFFKEEMRRWHLI